MDTRIADFIRDHRKRYTREAITQQLLEAGYDRASIDATWAALDTPDVDDTAGEGFWGRFFVVLVGINAAVVVLVGVLTGSFGSPERLGLLGILAVALAIGALIAWAIVAATGPARMGRTTATVIGLAIPLVFALLIGGTCYALLGAMGPPPRTGTLELGVELPGVPGGSGTATCSVADGAGFSVYGQVEGTRFVSVSIDGYPEGGDPVGEVANLAISVEPATPSAQSESWSTYAGSGQLDSQVSRDGLEGTVTFTDLASDLSGPEFEGPDPDPISGSISWSCE